MSNRWIKSLILDGIVVGEYLGSDDYEEDMQAALATLKSMGLHKEVSIFAAMRRQAESFTAMSHLAYNAFQNRRPSAPPITLVPFVVNSAFALELYLKTLIHANGGDVPRNEHRLTNLFKLLPSGVQQRIEQMTVEHRNRYAPTTAGTFAERLAPISTAFVRWRYAYEHDRLELVVPHSVILLLAACHYVCREQSDPAAK